MLDTATLVLAAVAYLGLLFVIAEVAERSAAVRTRWVRHPLVYALSLCVYATSWTFFGGVGYARDHGYAYATIGLGVTLSCLLVPLVWQRVLRIVRARQLSSVADLFAYHYASRALGAGVTLLLLAGSLPYLALQFRAVTQSLSFLSGEVHSTLAVGGGYVVVVTLFALLFGIRHDVERRQHPGLVAAIALESLVKLAAIIGLVFAAVGGVFGGFGELNAWVAAHPEALERLYAPVRSGPWVTLLVLAMSAAFLLPRQFHMAFTECADERALNHATWLFPALMLLFYGGTPILLWAGTRVAPGVDPDQYVLAIASRSHALSLLTFIGGLSASSAMVIVTALALSAMLLHHVVLPLSAWQAPRGDLYRSLRWTRRLLVLLVTGSGYLAFAALEHRGGLVELGLTAFVAVAQLLPGLFGVLFWPRATRGGVLAGLIAGSLVWALLTLPSLFFPSWDITGAFSAELSPWAVCTYLSLGLNVSLAVGVSLAFPADPRVGVVSAGAFATAGQGDLVALHDRLSPLLGAEATQLELRRALRDLSLAEGALSAEDFQRLSGRIEQNLTSLVGPLMASAIVGHAERAKPTPELAELVSSLRHSDPGGGDAVPPGPVRELLERILEELPVGICAVDARERVVMWNQRLASLSRIEPDRALGRELATLAAPWPALVREALDRGEAGRAPPQNDDDQSWLRVARCAGEAEDGVIVLLVEDVSGRRSLEANLAHQERLASLGRLSAAVAHEIGNPLAGLLMVAQNLERDVADHDTRERLGRVVREAQRIRGICESLLHFGRSGGDPLAEPMALEPLPVAALFTDALDLVRLAARARHVSLEMRGDLEAELYCDPRRMAQVLTNLVKNACDASRPGSRVVLEARAESDAVALDVVDTGHGIASAHVARIFEPFFTRSRAQGGTGLGLAVARSIVVDHGGTLEVVETGPHGSRIRARLPRKGRALASAGAV